MALSSKYRLLREGKWKLLVQPAQWSRELWEEVLRQSAGTARGEIHPETKQFCYPQGKKGREYYLKIYHRSHPFGTIKDLFRQSKSFRALKQGLALAEHGFHAPFAVAAGEERDCRLLKRAFLLTVRIDGSSIPFYLREHHAVPLSLPALREKRDSLKKLALEIGRLHRLGFVHGDLVPSNIFVRTEEKGVSFFYMDNDRTRRYPVWLFQRLWMRNLVQLNRFVLPGVSLQDRMRFLKSYLGDKTWGRKERRLARQLEKRTRERRLECDRIAAQVSFRELMRWNGPFTRNIQ